MDFPDWVIADAEEGKGGLLLVWDKIAFEKEGGSQGMNWIVVGVCG